MSKRDHRIPVLRRIVYATVFVVLLIGLGELALRLWSSAMNALDPSAPFGLPAWLSPPDEADGAGLPFVPVPGKHLHCEINSHGLWGPEPEMPKPPDLLRVVALGASSTQGPCPLTAHPGYPGTLHRLLQDFAPGGLRVEVINAGMEGYDASNLVVRLRRAVLPLKPDVVLIYSGWNNLSASPWDAEDNDSAASLVWVVLDRSAITLGVRRALHAVHDMRVTREAQTERLARLRNFSPRVFIEVLKEMVRLVREAGARPVLMTQASNLRLDADIEVLFRDTAVPRWASSVEELVLAWNIYSETIRQTAEALDADLIDTVPAMQRPDADALMYDFMHSTGQGYDVLAAYIAPRLKPILEEVARARRGAPAL